MIMSSAVVVADEIYVLLCFPSCAGFRFGRRFSNPPLQLNWGHSRTKKPVNQ